MANIEIKDIILAVLLIVIGVVFIVAPQTLAWLVGIAFILTGIVQLIPRSSRK